MSHHVFPEQNLRFQKRIKVFSPVYGVRWFRAHTVQEKKDILKLEDLSCQWMSDKQAIR